MRYTAHFGKLAQEIEGSDWAGLPLHKKRFVPSNAPFIYSSGLPARNTRHRPPLSQIIEKIYPPDRGGVYAVSQALASLARTVTLAAKAAATDKPKGGGPASFNGLCSVKFYVVKIPGSCSLFCKTAGMQMGIAEAGFSMR